MSEVQVTPGVTLSNVTPPNNLLLNSYFKNHIVKLHVLYVLLPCMSIFMPIGCYLPCDP